MRAVLYTAFGEPPAVREVADPVCPADGVVVRVEATGLCRSDWHGWKGHDPDIADLVVARELEILGSDGMAAHDYAAMLASVSEGRLDPSRLVGRTIDLDATPEALMAMDASQPVAGMTVILP